MTTTIPADLETYFAANAERAREELFDFLRIPSVSARSEHRPDMERAAEWLAAAVRAAGLAVEILPTAGNPLVLGEWRQAGAGAPTVLIYGHYDVQPAEPLAGWTSPPFEPALRDGRIYARGATDDKGQLFLQVKALAAHLAARGRLPVNVVLLAEGEEEVGSVHLTAFVERHAERLWTRPTCEINGLLSGYTGEGGKTVLPAQAMAKVSCRLVTDQDPAEIDRLFRAHIERVTPAGVAVRVTLLAGGPAWRAPLDGRLAEAASRAFAAAFGRRPVIMGDGGSLPVVSDFERVLGAPVLLMGFGLPGENAHAPNEWLSVENFERGMRAVAVLWEELGA